ncbi:MAG: type II toxin-antitoxin system HipA family toxin [Thermodesulfobacteriota bacterium]
MIRLVVWLTLPSGERVAAAETICGIRPGGFRYLPAFLNHAGAFALEPLGLPLGPDRFLIDRADGVAAVLEDALPDAWGRRLLARRAGLSRHHQTPAQLLAALGGSGLGALSFAAAGEPAPPDPLPGLPDLPRLLAAVGRLEADESLATEELGMLLASGSSAGGARPKALIMDGSRPAIAKLPSRQDRLSLVAIEAATMALARKAGIDTAATRLERVQGQEVLVVHRFDVTPGRGRRHMLSFQTLLQAEGWYHVGYQDLLGVLRRVSAQPEIDVPALYRQAVFNAIAGNTDDHLKNFTLLHDDRGFFLSPAYDLLPAVSGEVEHVLHFSPDHVCPSRRTLVGLGRRAGVPSPAGVVDQVLAAAQGFEEELAAAGVPEEEQRRLGTVVARNIALASP